MNNNYNNMGYDPNMNQQPMMDPNMQYQQPMYDPNMMQQQYQQPMMPQQPKKKSKLPIIIIVLILLIGIGVGGYFLYQNLSDDSDSKETSGKKDKESGGASKGSKELTCDYTDYKCVREFFEKAYGFEFEEFSTGSHFVKGESDKTSSKVIITFKPEENLITSISVENYKKEKEEFKKYLEPFLKDEKCGKEFDVLYKVFDEKKYFSYYGNSRKCDYSGDGYELKISSNNKVYQNSDVIVNDVDDYDIIYRNYTYHVKFQSDLFKDFRKPQVVMRPDSDSSVVWYSFEDTNELASVKYEYKNITEEKINTAFDKYSETNIISSNKDGNNTTICATYLYNKNYYVECQKYEKIGESCSGSYCEYFITTISYYNKDSSKRDDYVEKAKNAFEILTKQVEKK